MDNQCIFQLGIQITTITIKTDCKKDMSCAHGGGNVNFELSNSQNTNHLIHWGTEIVMDVNPCDQNVLNVWASRFCPGHERHAQYDVYPRAPVFQPRQVSHSVVVEAEVYDYDRYAVNCDGRPR